MSCRFDKEIIRKYADNTIDPLEYIFLKEHIGYCGECRRELDAVMALENELDKYFDYDSDVTSLDMLITDLVDDCMYELNKREKLKYTIKRVIRIGNEIMDNSLKFVEYIPGSKVIGNGAKKTTSIAGNFVKSIVKKEVGKLFTGLR